MTLTRIPFRFSPELRLTRTLLARIEILNGAMAGAKGTLLFKRRDPLAQYTVRVCTNELQLQCGD
jgi:hypothetical protein